MVLLVLGKVASLIGLSSPLDVVWGFARQSGVGAAHIFMGPAGEKAVLGNVVHFEFFHPFKVCYLGEMVSIMAILTTKGTREVCLNIVVVIPLAFVVIAPLGVLVPLVLVAPSRLVRLGLVLVSSWSRIIIVSIFSFIFGIVQLMGWISRIQLFKILILLNRRGLNKINPGMWLSVWGRNGLGG
jgi:hypothetical protein